MSSKRVIHIAQGVKPKQLQEAFKFYNRLFIDIEPFVGEIELGTGRKVNGAYWKGDYIYFFLFEGCEVSTKHGIDHIGIMFDTDYDRNWCRHQMNSDRWLEDPTGNLVWELFRSGEKPEIYKTEEPKELEDLYPKWKCAKCEDWFHMPYKYCHCGNNEVSAK